MIRQLLQLVILMAVCRPIYAQTLGQNNFYDTSNSASPAFASNTTAGDMLLICGGTNPAGTAGVFTAVPTMSDGTVMTQINGNNTPVTSGDNLGNQTCWANYNLAGGTKPTVTCHTTTADTGPDLNYAGCYYLEIGGANTIELATSNSFHTGVTPLSSPTINVTHVPSILVCIGSDTGFSGPAFLSAGAGWTGVAFGSQGIEYKIVTTTGNQQCSMNTNGTVSEYTFTLMSFYQGPPGNGGCAKTAVGSSSFVCVQAATNTAFATSIAATFATGYPASSKEIAQASTNANVAWTSGMLTNTLGSTWTFGGDCPINGGTQHTAIWYRDQAAASGASDTVTANNATSSQQWINVAVYTGVGAIDGSVKCGATPSGNATQFSGNFTGTVGDLVIGAGFGAAGPITVGGGFVTRENDTLGGGPYSMMEDEVAGVTTENISFGDNFGNAATIGVAFLPFSGAVPSSNVWSAGYYYPQSIGGLPVLSTIQWSALTHVFMLGGSPNADGTIALVTNFSTLAPALITAAHANNVKVLFSLSSTGGPTHFTGAVTNNEATFMTNIMSQVNTYGFDGVDVDDEEAWCASCMTTMLADLRTNLGAKLLTAFINDSQVDWGSLNSLPVPVCGSATNRGFSAAQIANLDKINAGAYDLANPGNGDPYTWHNSALYSVNGQYLWSADYLVRAVENCGVNSTKILIGIPFYGDRYTANTAPYQATGGGATFAQHGYNDLVLNFNLSGSTYDATAHVPWKSDSGSSYLSWENAQSVTEKVNYVLANNLGGWAVWVLGWDYTAGANPPSPLLAAIGAAFQPAPPMASPHPPTTLSIFVVQ